VSTMYVFRSTHFDAGAHAVGRMDPRPAQLHRVPIRARHVVLPVASRSITGMRRDETRHDVVTGSGNSMPTLAIRRGRSISGIHPGLATASAAPSGRSHPTPRPQPAGGLPAGEGRSRCRRPVELDGTVPTSGTFTLTGWREPRPVRAHVRRRAPRPVR
jgi:hypothetical protein